jgi:hypothetical protein
MFARKSCLETANQRHKKTPLLQGNSGVYYWVIKALTGEYLSTCFTSSGVAVCSQHRSTLRGRPLDLCAQ